MSVHILHYDVIKLEKFLFKVACLPDMINGTIVVRQWITFSRRTRMTITGAYRSNLVLPLQIFGCLYMAAWLYYHQLKKE